MQVDAGAGRIDKSSTAELVKSRILILVPANDLRNGPLTKGKSEALILLLVASVQPLRMNTSPLGDTRWLVSLRLFWAHQERLVMSP